MENSLEPLIKLETGFKVLDQKKLPTKFEYINVNSAQDAFQVIRDMNVRGAPFIAVVALYGLKEELKNQIENKSISNSQQFKLCVSEQIEYLKQSRPTAVNLFNDSDFINNFVQNLDEKLSIQELFQTTGQQIDKIDTDYVAASDQMAKFGYEKVLVDVPKIKNEGINVLTICNTGKLAVPGIGTALGLIREIHRQGKLNNVYIPETRPYLQGFRLTASEAKADNLPATLITDSMAGFLMKQNKIDLVVIGADRVAANGDTANKIGSYAFSVLAKAHNVPFYTVLPDSTIDRKCERGDLIKIEQRPKDELIFLNNTQIAPEGMNAYNPCFDVTPYANITRIITEKGEFVCDREIGDWVQMDSQKLEQHVKQNLNLYQENEELEIEEIGDGNLNLVYIITSKNTNKQIICKQALPYIRCVGPEWPFPLSRAFFESKALAFHNKYAQEYCPKLIHYDQKLFLITMEYLLPPFIILRKGLIAKNKYNKAAEHLGLFVAKTLFFSSGLHLSGGDLRKKISFWCGNNSLCELTEQVIFQDPYYEAQYNKHTSPQLDDIAKLIREDEELKFAISNLRHKFIHNKQALLHGDLHTGSAMVTDTQTKVIDPEFAFYGPMGFDLGAVIANYYLNYFSQSNDQDYKQHILQQIAVFWETFETEFRLIWGTETNFSNGCDYPVTFFKNGDNLSQKIRNNYINDLWNDAIGFAAAKIIRRIVGIAHVEDMDSILDIEIKAECERNALNFAIFIMKNPTNFANIKELNNYAQK